MASILQHSLYTVKYRDALMGYCSLLIPIPVVLQEALRLHAEMMTRSIHDHMVALLANSFEQADLIDYIVFKDMRYHYRHVDWKADGFSSTLIHFPDQLYSALLKASRKKPHAGFDAEVLARLHLSVRDNQLTFLERIKQSIAHPLKEGKTSIKTIDLKKRYYPP